MKENEIEKLLEKICREQIEPPEHLVVDTKQRLIRSRFLTRVIFISLLFNTLVTVSIAIVVFSPVLTWVNKILGFFGITSFFNGLIVLILLNREKIAAFFREFTYAVNHSE